MVFRNFAKLVILPTKKEIMIDKSRFSIGRNSDNDFIINNPFISRHHCSILYKKNQFYIHDNRSVNGIFVNGKKIKYFSALKHNDMIQFYLKSPIIQFVELNPAKKFPPGLQSKLARQKAGLAFYKSRLFLLFLLLFFIFPVFIYSLFNRAPLHKLIRQASTRQAMLEEQPLKDQTSPKENLAKEQASAKAKQEQEKNIEAPKVKHEDLISSNYHQLMSQFGEKSFVTDAQLIKKLNYYYDYYKNSYTLKISLKQHKKYLPIIKQVFQKYNVPLEFSYLPVIESNFNPTSLNRSSGARGMWQLMPHTARQYGLKVTRHYDERIDPAKSTEAIGAYLKDLISIFGIQSFTLILAAYNSGDASIRQSLRKIKNPQENRNFWYLYQNNLLYEETKEFVLKVLAIILISRELEQENSQ